MSWNIYMQMYDTIFLYDWQKKRRDQMATADMPTGKKHTRRRTLEADHTSLCCFTTKSTKFFPFLTFLSWDPFWNIMWRARLIEMRDMLKLKQKRVESVCQTVAGTGQWKVSYSGYMNYHSHQKTNKNRPSLIIQQIGNIISYRFRSSTALSMHYVVDCLASGLAHRTSPCGESYLSRR